jgi:hypothetical protein
VRGVRGWSVAVGKPAGEEEEGKKIQGGGWRLPLSVREKKRLLFRVFFFVSAPPQNVQNSPPYFL